MQQIPHRAVGIAAADDVAQRQAHFPGIPGSHRRRKIAGGHSHIQRRMHIHLPRGQQQTVGSKDGGDPHRNAHPIGRRRHGLLTFQPQGKIVDGMLESVITAMPGLRDEDPVRDGIHLHRIFSHGKIHIPNAEIAGEKQIQNIRHILPEGLVLQRQDLLPFQRRQTERHEKAAVAAPVLVNGFICGFYMGITSCGRIQHFSTLPSRYSSKYFLRSADPHQRPTVFAQSWGNFRCR